MQINKWLSTKIIPCDQIKKSNLHMSKPQVEFLNGTLEVNSELRNGTSFVIEFPNPQQALHKNYNL